MKYNDYHHDNRETPDGWRRELDQHLLLWDRLGYRRNVLKKGAAEDAKMWERLLPHARPIPPRTFLPGAKEAARLRGLDWGSLQESGEVLIEGQRVAIRWLRRTNDISMSLGGHGWEVFFSTPDLEDGSLELDFLRRFFRTVDRVPEGILASEEHIDRRAAVVPLAALTFSHNSIAHLRHCWGLARAFGITHELLDLLDEEQRSNLGNSFAEELRAAAEVLAAHHDARLAVFADGNDPEKLQVDWPAKTLPESRLEDLFGRERMLGYVHREIGNQYYEDCCFDAALLLSEYGLADLLKELPPGWAVFEGYDALCRFRPLRIASLVRHPGTNVQGIFALTRLQNRIHFDNGQEVDLSEEWERVQHLGRKIFLLGDKCNGNEALALGLDDFSHHLSHSFWRKRGLQPSYWSQDIWDASLAQEDFSEKTTGSLIALLSGATEEPSDTVFVFALQQLARLRELGRPNQQDALAAAIVSAYQQTLDVRARRPRVASPLPAFGRLLAELWRQLDSRPEVRATLLTPFDQDDFISLGKEAAEENSSRNYRYDVARTFESHASLLLATASEVVDPEPLLDAAVNLYLLTQKSALPVLPFDWVSMGNERRHGTIPGVDPLFMRLAKQAADAGLENTLKKVLDSTPAVHVLAAMRAGLSEQSDLLLQVEVGLREELGVRLSAGDLALGEVLDLAAFLNVSGWGPEAQRCAEHAIHLLDQFPRNATAFLEEAHLALALALANQHHWEEVLNLDLKSGGRENHALARNLRAAAQLELKNYLAAEKDLTWVLELDPHNHMALANYCASLHRQARWSELVDFVASRLAGASTPLRERLLVLKAGALSELGKNNDAALTLLAVGDGLGRHGDVSELARKISSETTLFGKTGPAASPRILYCEGGDDSIDKAFYEFLLRETGVEILPVGTHADVQKYVQQWGTAGASVKPRVAGVVDRDHYPDSRLVALQKVVNVLPLNEVECVLCHPNVIQLVARVTDLPPVQADDVVRALQARAAEISDLVLVQRFDHQPKGKGTPTIRAEALKLCTNELETARMGTADELLKFFPGKELLPAVKEFVGTDDARCILANLVRAGEEALKIEPLSTFRTTLLRALDL